MSLPGLVSYRAAGSSFAAWDLSGAAVDDSGALVLDPSADLAEALSPPHSPSNTFAELIASWNAVTPPGTWIETRARVRLAPSAGEPDRWTAWYSLGIWTAEDSAITRHSVARQEDGDARVATDTLILRRGLAADSLQLALRLHRSPGTVESPTIHATHVATSDHPAPPQSISRPGLTDVVVPLPQCSQMVYPDGGEVWCSPTSVSMVLAHWLNDERPCEPVVRAAVAGVYDHVYRGHGNWPFNTAYAFHFAHAAGTNLTAYVLRLPDLAAAERFLAAGIPLVLSYGWRTGELTGAPIATSNGHLVVLAGFDSRGDPIIHDPAAPSNATVRRTYRRAEIERLWLSHSAGTAYAIHPPHLLPNGADPA